MGGVWVNAPATCGSSKSKKVSNRGGGCAAGVLEGGEGRGGNGGQLAFLRQAVDAVEVVGVLK